MKVSYEFNSVSSYFFSENPGVSTEWRFYAGFFGCFLGTFSRCCFRKTRAWRGSFSGRHRPCFHLLPSLTYVGIHQAAATPAFDLWISGRKILPSQSVVPSDQFLTVGRCIQLLTGFWGELVFHHRKLIVQVINSIDDILGHGSEIRMLLDDWMFVDELVEVLHVLMSLVSRDNSFLTSTLKGWWIPKGDFGSNYK